MKQHSGWLSKIEASALTTLRRFKALAFWHGQSRLSIVFLSAAGVAIFATIAFASWAALLVWALLLPAAVMIYAGIILGHEARYRGAMRALRECEEKFRCVAENTQDAIIVAGAGGVVTYWNKAAERLFGYTQGESVGRNLHDILSPSRYREKAFKEYARFTVNGYGKVLNKPVRRRALRKDGSEFPVELLISGYPGDDCWNAAASVRDISEHEQAVTALEHRSKLLHGISLAANTLLASSQLHEAMVKAIEIVGGAADIDRIRLFLPQRLSGAPFHYGWLSPNAPEGLQPICAGLAQAEMEADPSLEPLRELKAVTGIPRTMAAGPVRTFCEKAGIRSFLLIPIAVYGHYRGRIAFSDCKAEREWSQSEIDTLSTLAGMIGDALVREQYVQDLENRSKLLHAISLAGNTLLTASQLDEALSKVLEIIGGALDIDRVRLFLPKRWSGPLFNYIWCSPTAPESLYPGSRDLGQTEIEADPLLAPLRELKTITGITRTTAAGPIRTFLESAGIRSYLVIPVAMHGNCQGGMVFSGCKAEREWGQSEIDTLSTVAGMIGASLVREQYIQELEDGKRIIEGSPTILFRLDGKPSLPLIYISHNITQLGYKPEELIGSQRLSTDIIHPDDRLAMRELLLNAVSEGRPGALEFRVLKRDGSYRWFESRYRPLRDASGRLLEIEGVMTDITQRKHAEQKFALLAMTDPLTGVANRATFIDRLRQAFAACKRGAKPFAVLYIDLDHFKDVNDTLGHSAGDLLLKAAVDRLVKNCRASDTVARLGGDEFAVLQTDLSGPSDIAPLVSKIHAVLGVPFQLGENEVHLSASIGISFYTQETASSEELLSQADLALYRAKEEGRDQYHFHSDDLDREVRERISLTEDLRQALAKEGELELYYQPQIEFSTGRIAGMEALIRWNHPTRGLLMPGDFISILEKSGATLALGQWVLDHACAQMNAWRDAGVAPETLAVNLSLGQLRTGEELVRSIAATLAKWGIAPHNLEIDVTEAMLAHVTLAQNNVLEQLQQLGVKIAIDDFGTQYSSLDYLKTYNVSRLKIPQAMIGAATGDANSSAMVHAILALARELNIEVVAQGIETEAQRDLLSATPSMTKVQGYYYSMPVPAGAAKELLRQGLIEPRLQQTGAVAAE